ncbi:MAG: hypothetical protein U9P82_06635 [Bacteroidota bacterium]|nr:hypothetical protein [Bacteroidota bacterium]
MKRHLFILFLILFFVSCSPYIWFQSPQPEGRKNLDTFPNELIGKYVSVSDSSIIIINSDKVIKQYHEKLMMSNTEFYEETGDSIAKDTSFLFTDNWHIKMKAFGDSVKVFSWKDETLFQISDDQLLREYKGYYFLNTKDTNNLWKVEILRQAKDTLEYDDILKKEDIDKIKSITAVKEIKDTTREKITRYYLNPSKRELREILKTRSRGEKFFRIHEF